MLSAMNALEATTEGHSFALFLFNQRRTSPKHSQLIAKNNTSHSSGHYPFKRTWDAAGTSTSTSSWCFHQGRICGSFRVGLVNMEIGICSTSMASPVIEERQFMPRAVLATTPAALPRISLNRFDVFSVFPRMDEPLCIEYTFSERHGWNQESTKPPTIP